MAKCSTCMGDGAVPNSSSPTGGSVCMECNETGEISGPEPKRRQKRGPIFSYAKGNLLRFEKDDCYFEMKDFGDGTWEIKQGKIGEKSDPFMVTTTGAKDMSNEKLRAGWENVSYINKVPS